MAQPNSLEFMHATATLTTPVAQALGPAENCEQSLKGAELLMWALQARRLLLPAA